MYFLFLKNTWTIVLRKQFFSSLSCIRSIMVVFQESIMVIVLAINFCYQQKYLWKQEYLWLSSQFLIARSLRLSHLHDGITAKCKWNMYLSTIIKNTWILDKRKGLQGNSSCLRGSNFQTLKKDLIKWFKLKWKFHWEFSYYRGVFTEENNKARSCRFSQNLQV